MQEKDILENLNPEQAAAVTHPKGPLLIIAGAGTGKTTVLTRRIAYLISAKLAKPGEILALTFTDKAAGEMEERVDKLVPYGYIDVSISTFHAFGDRVLRDHSIDLGLPPDFRVMSLPEQIIFFRQHLFDFPLHHYIALGDPTRHIEALIGVISRAKDEDVCPEEYVEWAEKGIKGRKSKVEIRNSIAEHEKQLEVARIYQKYQELKLQKGMVDFGDQVNLTLKLFREHPAILKEFQERYKYILVDEFQDTNYAQFELLKLLVGKKGNITVVGDDDQCLPPNALIETICGKKRIKNIKEGDKVLTAVGKGHLSYGIINKIIKNKKYCRLVTFETKSGKTITVTSNHKMFCFVPSKVKHKKYYYVYLMHRSNLGWRIGVTNDLATRLRLERSADRIIGLRAFDSEEEARYFETLWALKYGIPTVCFAARSDVMIKGKWLKKLYEAINTEIKVKHLAYDLDIDLNSHHLCLAAVQRGNKNRIKINLEMCYRKYVSKNRQNAVLVNPLVLHQVNLETSEEKTINKLKKFKFPLTKAKKGYRVRMTSKNINEIGEIAAKLRCLTGGIIDVKFNLGTMNKQHLPALVMPASNVLKGHYLPIIKGNRIIYDQIVRITSTTKKETVYDLEVERTHNFVADGIVVHNSIYKFRGAAISNILSFEDLYRKAAKIVLTQNYRSTQIILDTAYRLIRHNDPERLEIKSKVDKKLKSVNRQTEPENEFSVPSELRPVHKHFDSVSHEADWVAQFINERKYPLKDYAILVRSNADAEPFRQSLNLLGIPHQFSGGGGLYVLPEVKLLVSFLRVIGDPSDSLSLYSLALSEIYKINPLDLQKMNIFASRRNLTLHHVFTHLANLEILADIKEESREVIRKIMEDVAYYLEYAKQKTTGEVLYQFMKKSGYLEKLSKEQNTVNENKIKNIAQFFEKVRAFKEVAEVDRVAEFVKHLNVMKEAGDDPESARPDLDADAVSVLTVHKAKGLEFAVVFMVALLDGKFPARGRKHPIELPDELIKEAVPTGDFHLMEERRLFYVGMTRAKKELYLTSAVNYGGKRDRKVSPFVLEALDMPKADVSVLKKSAVEQIELFAPAEPPLVPDKKMRPDEIIKLSHYQIDDYRTCPLKYKFVHVLRVPLLPNHAIIYGSALHKAAQAYFTAKKNGQKFSEKDLLDTFTRNWSAEGFISRQHEEQRFQNGQQALRNLIKADKKRGRDVKFVEEEFTITQDNITVRGRWDLVEIQTSNLKIQNKSQTDQSDQIQNEGQIFIVDFKSSEVREDKKAQEKAKGSLQLAIYALAWQKMFGSLPDGLELYFFESGLVGQTVKDEGDLRKTWEEIKEVADGIRSAHFPATPDYLACKYCAYTELCPRAKG